MPLLDNNMEGSVERGLKQPESGWDADSRVDAERTLERQKQWVYGNAELVPREYAVTRSPGGAIGQLTRDVRGAGLFLAWSTYPT